MAVVVEEGEEVAWGELVRRCYGRGVDLTGHHMGHSIADNLANYTVMGAAVTEVVVDVLTGQHRVIRCDFIEDTGVPTSPLVDVGQVEGGLVMGLGLWTSEQVRYHPDTGRLLDNSTWHYKVPTALDIPEDLRIELFSGSNKKGLVLGSKAVGEPSVLGGVSVLLAIRAAVASARRDGGLPPWVRLDGPATPERVWEACGVDTARLLP